MTRRSSLDSVAILAGFVGSLAVALTSIVAALAYTGTAGERFSPLNHFVSELGELGVSELARLFNLGLNVGGIGFVAFMVGMAATRSGRLRYAYALTGVIAGLGGFFVGVFPMNDIGVHGASALTFFVLGLVTVLLASVDVWRAGDRRFPRWLASVGVLTAMTFAIFLVLLGDRTNALASPTDRPKVWPLTIFEWLLLVGLLLWVFLAALTWWRATR